MPFASIRRTVLVATLAVALVSPLAAESRIDPERSVLAVLTHKAGIAAALAHDHLVTAPIAALTLAVDPATPDAVSARLDVEVNRLEIDHHAARARWKGRLRELGAGPERLDPVAENDRAKVRAAMLDDDQLDAARHPRLAAELVALRRGGAPKPFDGFARLALTLHGKTVERDVPATWKVEGGGFSAEALGEFRFTEFGIEPYSGPLGAVKNQDRFHLYVALAGRVD
jgi:hypothetical protein